MLNRIRKNTFSLVGLALLLSATVLAACQPAAGQPAVDQPAAGQPATAKGQLQGTVEAIGANSLTVNGQTVALPAGYTLDERLSVGDRVLITGTQSASGVLMVSDIVIESDVEEVEIVGTLEALDAASATIDGQTYALLPGAEIEEDVAVGMVVKAHLVPQADGSFAIRELELAEDEGEDDSSDDEEVEIVGTLEALDATSATIDGQTYALLPGAEIKEGVAVGMVVKAHLVPQADGSLAIRELELAEDEDDDSSDDEDDSDSSDDDEDDDSGVVDEYEIVGTLEAISATSITVDGVTYGVTSYTEFEDGVQVGAYVEVHIVVMSDGSHIAYEVNLADSPAGDDSSSDDEGDDDSSGSDDDSNDDGSSGDDSSDDDSSDDDDSDDDSNDDDHGGSGGDDDEEDDDD